MNQPKMEDVTVPEKEKRKWLAEAKRAAVSITRSRERRNTAIRMAWDAGASQAELMGTTGLSRKQIYNILSHSDDSPQITPKG